MVRESVESVHCRDCHRRYDRDCEFNVYRAAQVQLTKLSKGTLTLKIYHLKRNEGEFRSLLYKTNNLTATFCQGLVPL